MGKGTSSAATSSLNTGSTGSSIREKNSWAQRGHLAMADHSSRCGRPKRSARVGGSGAADFPPREASGIYLAELKIRVSSDELRDDYAPGGYALSTTPEDRSIRRVHEGVSLGSRVTGVWASQRFDREPAQTSKADMTKVALPLGAGLPTP